MRDKFQAQIALLDNACRELHLRPDDRGVHDAVLSVLAEMAMAPYSDASLLVRGLANMVRQHASNLEYHVHQKCGAPDDGKLARAASEVCIHINDLKQALALSVGTMP